MLCVLICELVVLVSVFRFRRWKGGGGDVFVEKGMYHSCDVRKTGKESSCRCIIPSRDVSDFVMQTWRHISKENFSFIRLPLRVARLGWHLYVFG